MMEEALFETVVSDMADHVGSKVHEIVKAHALTMPSAGAAGDMGARVAAGLAIDVAMFVGLSAFDEGWTEAEISEAFGVVLVRVATEVARNRDDALAKVKALISERRAA